MRIPATFCALLALSLAGSGCVRSPKVNFYTIAPGEAPRKIATSTFPAVVVGPVTIPELVDRPQLVVRMNENRVAILESHRWAEPLKSEIPRVLARNLGQLLGSTRVTSYGQSSAGDAQYRVLVDVVRLDSVPGESVTVEASWAVRGLGSARSTGRSLVQEKVTGAGYEPLAAALGRALARVSGDIATAIRAEGGVQK